MTEGPPHPAGPPRWAGSSLPGPLPMPAPLTPRPPGSRPVQGSFGSQRPALVFILALAALISAACFAGIPQDGPHPLALLASLLPLQLAALLWGVTRWR